MADIIFKRGQESNRTSIIPKFGEPIVSNDNGKPRLWIGDSQTPGGIEIGASESTETISSIPSTILSFKGYKIKKFRIRISANDINNEAMLGHFSVKPLGGSWTDDPTDFVITKGANSSYNLNPTITHFGFEYGEHVPWTVCNIPTSSTYDGTFVEFTLSFADGLAKEIDRLIFAGTNTHTGKYHAMSLAVQIESEAGSNANGADGIWRDMVSSGSMQYNFTASLDTSYKWIIIDNESYTPEFIMDLGWKKIKKARLRISGNSLDSENVDMQRFLFYDENNNYANNTMLTWATGKYSSSNLTMANDGSMFYESSSSADVGRPRNHRAEVFLELVVTFNDVRKLTKVDVMLDGNTDQNYEMFCVDVQFEGDVGVNADGSDGTWYRIILPRSISGTEENIGHYIQYIANNLVESKENILGNPSEDGMVLSSTISGDRSWINTPQQVLLYWNGNSNPTISMYPMLGTYGNMDIYTNTAAYSTINKIVRLTDTSTNVQGNLQWNINLPNYVSMKTKIRSSGGNGGLNTWIYIGTNGAPISEAGFINTMDAMSTGVMVVFSESLDKIKLHNPLYFDEIGLLAEISQTGIDDDAWHDVSIIVDNTGTVGKVKISWDGTIKIDYTHTALIDITGGYTGIGARNNASNTNSHWVDGWLMSGKGFSI